MSQQKHKQILKQLSTNKAIVIMMQDKGCGVVIMNQSNNFDKCLSKLKSTQFNRSDLDPSGILKNKIRRTLSLSYNFNRQHPLQ